ncbi:MAG: HAD hydrolase family protein [Rhodospirillaceae bacterium]|jgi:YrbI family 3-deoxy-D-manno-octulosonate 8-phosphate phosphatase|nr:HAD hydrolase family protein [Rhodospirillaceae bacterium]MBT3887165.1 HAD hydrolase family protein [Rhodospirillaceae bacterium]MBT4115521.1 HAD hydrolase family protein [Rhodospirillaceae bacterium]MBT4673528.1 HAD hydrolase family protein [Rhodospirillaceae bacterium]MBT4721705.1 HAD hydrolase family protein [Rhodospirillaceae bacterium]
MTDNRVMVREDGLESVMVHRGDGLAIGMLKAAGASQIILSMEKNPVVAARAAKLGIPCISGLNDKAAVLKKYAAEHHYSLADAVFVGNDINDSGVMALVGHAIAPADAHASIRAVAHHITRAEGGYGVIRELIDGYFQL